MPTDVVQFSSYENYFLVEYKEFRKIKSNRKEFHLQQKLLLIHPDKRIASQQIILDPYFLEDAVPTANVFVLSEA